jgi:hypothetical protein
MSEYKHHGIVTFCSGNKGVQYIRVLIATPYPSGTSEGSIENRFVRIIIKKYFQEEGSECISPGQ